MEPMEGFGGPLVSSAEARTVQKLIATIDPAR